MKPHKNGPPLTSHARKWFEPFLKYLAAPTHHPDYRLRSFFRREEPVVAARAPGRLDVMGGIADYSGSLVLQLPLANATYAAIQKIDSPNCEIVSVRHDAPRFFEMELEALQTGILTNPVELRNYFLRLPHETWAAYVIGLVHFCLHRSAWLQPKPAGFRMLIYSEVPEGKGVSSSAALEVAAMTALTAFYDLEMKPRELAGACEWVENRIVGAPCGIMDQMTSMCGRRDHLLKLLCQPDRIEGFAGIPPGYRFSGIDSGIRHQVSGANYGTVRTAAFMGYRMIADATEADGPDSDAASTPDDRWNGYLANVTPRTYEARFREVLPARLSGRDFLAAYDGITDTVTTVDPDRVYPVRRAAEHPIYEHCRVRQFAKLLEELPDDREAALQMGELMYESHDSYNACGLGSDGTDRLVDLVVRAGPAQGLFGAKITGGGSGGTVAVFSTEEAGDAISEIASRYADETGRAAEVFAESGPGAAEIGPVLVPSR